MKYARLGLQTFAIIYDPKIKKFKQAKGICGIW